MGYIGNEPTTGHFPVQTNLVGPGPTYTLTNTPASAGAIEVSVSGVLQPTTAYSVSGSTLTMAGVGVGIPIFIRYLGETLSLPTPADGSVTTVKLVDDAVTTGKIAAGAVGTTDIADDAVTIAKLAATGTASSSTFLRGDNAWAAAGGGAWTMLTNGTQVASGSASLTVTGLDSTYAMYVLVGADLKPATNAQAMYLRVGDSSGVDSGGSDYSYYSMNVGTGDGGAPHAASNSNSTSYIKVGHAVGSSAEDATSFVVYLNRGTSYPNISGTFSNQDNASPGNVTGGFVIGQREAVITLDRVQVLFASGNIASGRFTVYGIKHT